MTTPATAPQREIGYAQNTAHGGYWWTLDDESTPELTWPNSVAVYDQMRRTDAQCASVLRAVTLPVRRTPWRIDPNGARDEVVELVATDLGLPIVGAEAPEQPMRMRDRFSWPEHLRQALLMLVFGHSYFEMTFRVDKDGNRAHLHKLSPRPAKTIERIEVARDGGLVWIKQYPAGPGGAGDSQRPIPVGHLVAYVHDREGGNWLGTSVLRAAYKNWLLKDRLLRVQAQTIERNGMGIPLYKAQEGATSDDITAGRDMATAWRAGEAAGSAIPFGADLVLRGVEGTLPDAEKVVRYHDEQIARAVLAHFLNLGTQTGSWALGTTFADFFTLSLQTLAQQIADTATMHVIEDLVDVNFGEDEPAPRLVFDEIGSRQAATAQAIKSLIDSGAIKLDDTLEEFLRQQYGMPPKDPETARAEDEAAVDADAMVAAIDAFRGGGAQPVAAAAGPDFNRLHPRDTKGRFRDTFARILDGLTRWAAAGGKGDPFEGFDREPLRRTAVARGITLKRGASRDDIADALLANLREALAGMDEGDEPETKPVKKAAPKKAKPAAGSPEDIAAELRTVESREEARELLAGKTVAQLRAIADAADVTLGRQGKENITNDLIYGAVGRRLDRKVIRDVDVSSPASREADRLDAEAAKKAPAKKATPRAPAKKAASPDVASTDGRTSAQLRDIAEAEGIPLPKSANRDQLAATIRDFRFHRDNPTAAFFVDPDRGDSDAADRPQLPAPPGRQASETTETVQQIRDIAEAEGIPLPRNASRDQLAAIIRDFRFHRDNPTASFLRDPRADTTPDSVQQARARQADIDTARTYAHLAATLDELTANEVSDATLLSRLEASVRRGDLPEAEVAPILAAVRGDASPTRAVADLKPGDMVPSLDPADDEPREVTHISKVGGGDLVVHYRDPRRKQGGTGAIRLESDMEVEVAGASTGPDRAEAQRLVATLLASRGITQDGNAGDTGRFTPSLHQGIAGSSIRPGAPVEVVRPGFTLERDGERIRLSKAVVEEAGEAPAPAERAAASPTQRRQAVAGFLQQVLTEGEGVPGFDARLGNLGSMREVLERMADDVESGNIKTKDLEDIVMRPFDGAAIRFASSRDRDPTFSDPFGTKERPAHPLGVKATEWAARLREVLSGGRGDRGDSSTGERTAFSQTIGDLSTDVTVADGRTVEGQIRDRDGKVVGSFRYLLDPDTGTAHNDSIALAPEHQRKGFATEFVERVEADLARQGFTRATVSAAFGGGHVWAKRYDRWDSSKVAPFGDVPSRMAARAAKTSDSAERAQLRVWLDRFGDDRADWPTPKEIAESPYGRTILDGASWQGERDLSDTATSDHPLSSLRTLDPEAAGEGAAEAAGRGARESVLGGPMDENEELLHGLTPAEIVQVAEDLNIQAPVSNTGRGFGLGRRWPSGRADRIRYVLQSLDLAAGRSSHRGRWAIPKAVESVVARRGDASAPAKADASSFDERLRSARQGASVEDLPPVQIQVDASSGSDVGKWRATEVTGYTGSPAGLLSAATHRVRTSGHEANEHLRFPEGRPMDEWEVKLREGYSGDDLAKLEAMDASRKAKQAATGARDVKALDAAMAQSRLPADVVVWRGVRPSDFGLPDGDAAGFEWTDAGYVGTSARRDVAAGSFAQGATLRILAPAGTPAIAIQGGGEGEVMLGRGLRFRVVADRRTGTDRELDVEVVPDTERADFEARERDRREQIEAVPEEAKPKKRAPAVDPGEVAARLTEQMSESAMIALLAGDPRLTASRLRKVAEALGIDVPEDMRAKSTIQLHIAEQLAKRLNRVRAAAEVDEDEDDDLDEPAIDPDVQREVIARLESVGDEPVLAAVGHDVRPGNDQLHHWWVYGKGRARWSTWTELYDQLASIPEIGPAKAKRFASAWFHERYGFWPGADLNRVKHGKPPRGERIGPG